MRKASSADQMVSLDFELIVSTPVRGGKASLKRFVRGCQTILYFATNRSARPRELPSEEHGLWPMDSIPGCGLSGFQCFASRNESTGRNILEITIALLYTAKQPSCFWEGTLT